MYPSLLFLKYYFERLYRLQQTGKGSLAQEGLRTTESSMYVSLKVSMGIASSSAVARRGWSQVRFTAGRGPKSSSLVNNPTQ